jgi:hypothetical protein
MYQLVVLGACDKIHNDRLKERYQKSNDKHKYPYEAEFYDYLNKLISDLSRKIRQGNGRLNIQSDDKVNIIILYIQPCPYHASIRWQRFVKKREKKKWFSWTLKSKSSYKR